MADPVPGPDIPVDAPQPDIVEAPPLEEKAEVPEENPFETVEELLEQQKGVKEEEEKGEELPQVGLKGIPGSRREVDIKNILKGVDDATSNPINEPTFNPQTITDAIKKTFDPNTGVTDQPTAEAAAENFTKDVTSAISKGLALIQRKGDPTLLPDLVSTVAVGVKNFVDGLEDEEVADVIHETVELLLGSILPNLRKPKVLHGVGIERLREITGLTDDVRELSTERLNVNDINRIRNDFLNSVISNQLEPRALIDLSNSIANTVKNGVLRRVLQEDIAERLRSLRNRGIEEVRTVEVKDPLTLEIIDRPNTLRFVKTVNDNIAKFEKVIEKRGNKAILRKNIQALKKKLNDEFEKLDVRGADGELIQLRIPTSGSAEQQLKDLKRVTNKIGKQKKITYSISGFSPSGMNQNATDIVNQIIRSTKSRPKNRLTGHLLHPTSEIVFGESIEVKTDKMEGKYEITIKDTTPLEDLLKLADALSKEDGVLENFIGDKIFTIKQDMDIHQITKFIQELYEDASGGLLRIIYIPDDPAGGMHVGGSLSMIYDRKITPPFSKSIVQNEDKLLGMGLRDLHHFGGKVKVSDVSAGIGTVASGLAATGIGAPLALPVAAVSGIITGLGKIFGF